MRTTNIMNIRMIVEGFKYDPNTPSNYCDVDAMSAYRAKFDFVKAQAGSVCTDAASEVSNQ